MSPRLARLVLPAFLTLGLAPGCSDKPAEVDTAEVVPNKVQPPEPGPGLPPSETPAAPAAPAPSEPAPATTPAPAPAEAKPQS